MRTLFRSSDLLKPDRGSGGHYSWLDPVTTLHVSGHTVLVNPVNGGWVELEKSDEGAVTRDRPSPQGSVGQFLFKVGLCTKDGATDRGAFPVPPDETLYFFEFIVTSGCNLACTYCFASASPAALANKASAELSELFIDRIAQYRVQTQTTARFVIEFTGGEPLANFPAIRHAIEYANHTYGDLLNAEFCLQTNGTLLSERVLDWLIANRVSIGISCDGVASIQNTQRPFATGKPSHSIVERNAKRILADFTENSGGVIAVVTQSSVGHLPELTLYFALCGFREVILRPMEALGRGEGEHSAPDPSAYVKGLFDAFGSVITPIFRETGIAIEERHLGLTFKHLLSPNRPFMCERAPCGAARNICAVDSDGDVYSCNQAAGDSRLCLGNIHDHGFAHALTSDVARRFARRTPDRIPACRDCPYRGWCQAPCPLGGLRHSSSFLEKSADCDIVRRRYRRALLGLATGEFDLKLVGKLAGTDEALQWARA
jgi:uncharacterized protein